MTMKSLVCLVLGVLVFAYGTMVTGRILKNKGLDLETGERCAMSIGLNALVIAVLAVILSLFGKFHMVPLCILYVLIATIAGIGLGAFKSCSTEKITRQKIWMGIKAGSPLACILILASVLYLVFPTYYMWSGRDYGLYIVNAIHTAETGSSTYETDAFLEENYEEVEEFVELGYPALFSSYEDGVSENPGDINAQFLPLYWCLLAIGYSLVGMRGLVGISGVLSLVTLAIYYYLGKRIFNKRVAVTATLLLAICPAQLWGARITQSEQMAQLIFVLAVSLFSYGWYANRKQFLYLATAVLGIGCFCRMDNYILGLGIIAIGIYTALWCREKRKTMLYAVIQYMVWLLTSIAYGFAVHYHYYYEHWEERGVLKYLILGNVGLLLVYVVVYLLSGKITWKKNPAKEICSRKKCVLVAGVLLALFFIYMYLQEFLRQGNWTVASNLQEYCWYICPLTFGFALYGITKKCMVKDEEDYNQLEAILLFLGIGLISTMLYTVKPSISMDHYWMSRRWVTVNFPFVIVFGMYGIDRVWSSKSIKRSVAKIISAGCAIFIFLYV